MKTEGADESAACPICGGREARTFGAKGLEKDDPRFSIVRCVACGFEARAFTSGEEIGRWYPQTYYGDKNVRFNFAIEALVRIFRRRRARLIRSLTEPGRVLDVGCGRGVILSRLRALGYEAHGTELSENAAYHARALGLDVHVGDFLSSPHPEGSFRAVIFWHSLEHFRDPLAAIARAKALLETGGLLVIAVPNSDSLQARSCGPSWFHLNVPRHYVHWGTRSLLAALERAGFRVRTVSHFALEQNPYGWLQSLYNACGFEYNLLYSLLKSKSARRTLVHRHTFQVLAILLLLPVFLALAFGLWALEVVLRRGGTITNVYAIKQ